MHLLRHWANLGQFRILEQPLWRARMRRRLSRNSVAPGTRIRPSGITDLWISQQMRRGTGHLLFSSARREEYLRLLESFETSSLVMEEGELTLRHQFDLLGSGETDLGARIDWHRDFKSGKVWEKGFYADLDYINSGEPSDVKVPWELSRFHCVAWLGKAFWLTEDVRFAREFQALVTDWIETNPFLCGIHWTVAMEVAIRACNWIQGLCFFSQVQEIPFSFWKLFWRSLYEHGTYIRHNLEYGRRPNNHYVADGVGLVFCGACFLDLPEGRRWLRLGADILEEAMACQVQPDGVHFEKSVSYHRLVLELFQAAYLLGGRNGVKWSPAFRRRLERMYEFVQAYTKPDGSAPLLSDSDNGRLFRISRREDFNDHRHQLAVGAALFGRGDFKEASAGCGEEVLWLLGPEGLRRFEELRKPAEEPASRAFPAGGYYIFRDARSHLIIDVGDIGLQGWGGHGHNDTLSFELFAGDQTFITDCGTYAYTGDEAAHQVFSGTLSHNAIAVDRQEVAEYLFMWRIRADRTNPRVRQWNVAGAPEILEAEHYGYTRLPEPVVHGRKILFWKKPSRWVIEDTVRGRGSHRCDLLFHIHPEIRVERTGEGTFVLRGRTRRLDLACDGRAEVQDGWYSPSYGVKRPLQVLCVTKTAEAPICFRTEIREILLEEEGR